jgi:hypothetical protein
MKIKLLIVLMFFWVSGHQTLEAQAACNKTIFTASTDVTQRLYTEAELKVKNDVSYAKPDIGNIAPDVDFEGECSATNVCRRNGASLVYDMFYPKNHDYKNCPLPVMIMFHPGGFSDCSDKNNDYMRTYCREFARRGFVAINLEYRRGVNEDENQPDRRYSTANQMLAIYRAVQDLRGAVRSIVARQLDNSFSDVKIDPQNIFIGGAGTTVMSAAFYNQKMFNDLLPGVEKSLGKLDEKFYYGGIAIPFKVKGVMNLWGGIFSSVDRSFADYFLENKDSLPPLISFHGALDDLIPIEQAPVYILDSPFNKETFCLDAPFTIKNRNGSLPDFFYIGSKTIYEVFTNILKVPTELYVDCNMDHRLTYSTGFGTGQTNPDSIQNYIVARSATFFQAVVNNKTDKLKDSKFIDCANYRKANNWNDDNDDCKESDKCESFGGGDKFFKTKFPAEISKLYDASYLQGNLVVKMHQNGPTMIEIFNEKGELLKTRMMGNIEFKIDLTSLDKGLYFIRISQNGRSGTEKIIFQ